MQEAEAADLRSAGFPTSALEQRVIVFLVIVMDVLVLCWLFFHLNYEVYVVKKACCHCNIKQSN